MILVKTNLARCTSGFIGSSSSIFGSCVSVDLRFSLACCIWPLVVAIGGGRCLLVSLIVRLGHVSK